MSPEEAEKEEAEAQEPESEEGAPAEPEDAVEAERSEETQEEDSAEEPKKEGEIEAQAVEFPSFDQQATKPGSDNLDLLMDVGLKLRVELGRTKMLVEDILKLTQGSVIELNKLAGDPVDILVNERLVAKGEVLVVDDNFCIRVTEIISPRERLMGAGE